MTMSKPQSDTLHLGWIGFCALTAMVVPWSLVHAERPIHERRAADPQGEIEIINVAGAVEVQGWDRREVEVGGTAGDKVERVDVTSMGNHTSIHVVLRADRSWDADAEAHLVIQVPSKSALTASLVSADFKVAGVLGDLKVQSVSGSLRGDVGGNVRATTVSGGVRLTARTAKSVEVKTISGDIQLTGGGGEVEITTVSGSAVIELDEVTRGRFKSVSGGIKVELALAPDGQLESESVSGNVSLQFAAAPAAEFDVQSFSGDISNCFGPKPMQSRYGPGSRLQFRNGDGRARVRVNTKSGDVKLCGKGMSSGHVSMLSLAQPKMRMVIPYVY
jgi:DUF4097 and DUF4098 domain-containing protein YvlB